MSDCNDNPYPTHTEKNVLYLLFGNPVYDDDPLTLLFRIIGLSIIITFLFWVFSCYLMLWYNPILVISAYFLFILSLLLLFTRWKDKHFT